MDYGIYILTGSPTIIGNTIRGNNIGINVIAEGPLIIGNIINFNNFGIAVGGLFGNPSPTITGNIITGNSLGIFIFRGSAAIIGNTIIGNMTKTDGAGIMMLIGSAAIIGNTITGNSLGIIAEDGSATIHFNRIVGNNQGEVENLGPVRWDAENNWWGSNADPSSKISGNVDFDPWFILNVSANPDYIQVGGTSTITADFTQNSDGQDTSSMGHIPDGTAVTFTTDLGNLGSKSVLKYTLNGKATTTLITDEGAGTATVSAQTDNQTVQTIVIIQAPGPTPEAGAITVPMQPTGVPLGFLAMAVLMIFVGSLMPKRK